MSTKVGRTRGELGFKGSSSSGETRWDSVAAIVMIVPAIGYLRRGTWGWGGHNGLRFDAGKEYSEGELGGCCGKVGGACV